jgi:hypothetical protein
MTRDDITREIIETLTKLNTVLEIQNDLILKREMLEKTLTKLKAQRQEMDDQDTQVQSPLDESSFSGEEV